MTIAEYLTSHLNTPFEWGRFDCILFSAGWAKQATGVDYLTDIPTWNSAKQAMRMVDEYGGLEAILDARFERINPNLAMDGDLAVDQNGVRIFSGPHIVGTGDVGLVFMDRLKAEGAWSLAKRIHSAHISAIF